MVLDFVNAFSVHIEIFIFFFSLLIWCFDFYMLNQTSIPGINPTWSCCIILTMCCKSLSLISFTFSSIDFFSVWAWSNFFYSNREPNKPTPRPCAPMLLSSLSASNIQALQRLVLCLIPIHNLTKMETALIKIMKDVPIMKYVNSF